jgi:hypothetical protein
MSRTRRAAGENHPSRPRARPRRRARNSGELRGRARGTLRAHHSTHRSGADPKLSGDAHDRLATGEVRCASRHVATLRIAVARARVTWFLAVLSHPELLGCLAASKGSTSPRSLA